MITRAFSAGIIAFFTSLDILANMVSIGTLFAFFMVAAALFFYRLYDDKVSTKREGIIALVHLLLIVAASLGARSLLPASSA
jgi:APA family basic amino acid/polyamine antiporter